MRYRLTGNFQYDLGIYGLKVVLDFFKEDYNYGDFWLEVDKSPEEILELITLKLMVDEGFGYFLRKIKSIKEKRDDEKLYDSKLREVIVEEKSLDKAVDFLSEAISEFCNRHFPEHKEITRREIEEILWGKLVELLNKVLLNFQPNKKVKGKKAFELALEKLKINEKDDKIGLCSFCGRNRGKEISRNTFFFAPARRNAFWFNRVSIFICPYCLASNLAITQSFIPLSNKNKETVAIYVPNLKLLEDFNKGLRALKFKDLGEVVNRVIEVEYEKLKLRYEAAVNDLQIVEVLNNSQNPHLEIYFLTNELKKKFSCIRSELDSLYTKYGDKLWGSIRTKKGYKTINISKELIKFLILNQKLFYLVQRFSRLSLMAEFYRIRKDDKPFAKGFYPQVLLEILKIHFKLEEGLDMEYLEAFKDYGQRLRKKIYANLAKEGKVSQNTFNNKLISVASSFLEASKGSFEYFTETLTRVMISYGVSVDAYLLSIISKTNYKEIATVIALSVMTESSRKDRKTSQEGEQQQEEVAEL